ncbi:60S ribosome subunit biogenesis protein nip7 [Grifola frondosa]|uniref:60S ribosome subunit biogenesis protein nip7 n=1 Tax=Grifola frondosa TaxID=5627 RepID=A0A1C7MPK1_GRIFR|nr:60S ribosome subunit biogenesis protein nip7 [Grifola frondosa]
MRLGISVARPNLVSLGTCFGKFTKSGKFKLHITALDYLAQYAKYKVWIKPNDTPEHQGVVVLGFGVTARSTIDTRKLDPTAIIVFHQADVGEYLRDEVNAQLCRIRAVFLDRLDRLNTFVEVCKEAPVAEESPEDAADEEWEDDPWGDGATEPPSAHPSKAAGQPPLPLSSFLSTDLIELACLLASLEYFAALHIVMDRHASNLWPFRFVILDSIPEHAQASQFRDILPGYDASADSEQRPEAKPWRSEQDFSESIQTTVFPSRTIVSHGHAASQGVPGLDEVGEGLSLLSRLVYDAPGPEDALDVDWSLARWNAMEPPDVIRAYLAHSTPKTVAKDIGRLVMPYLFVLESRAERAGRPDPSLPNRLLYDYILSAPLDIVAAIFEASKPTLPPAQRLLRNDEDMARLALACLYGNDSLDDWPTMSRTFECLPAWDTPPEEEDEADEANATIDSLGAFVAPSTTRPRCTPADLLLFFKPLPMSSLSRALDVLDVHLESGEILARWSVPAPLRWFLQSNGNISEQRSWANRMARRAGGTDDKLETQDEWEWLLEDMLKLDDIIRTFFSGLLSTGKFDVAKSLLRSTNVQLSLDSQVIEDICLSCSQEFYDNASSGNYHFGDMKLAYDCLDVPERSEKIMKEKEFIEATSRLCSFNLMSRPGIPISPIEIRLTKDRLSLVSRVLSSNNDAYKHTQVILDLVYKLGFKGDIVAEVKTLAMLAETALQAEDFNRAYETSQRMVDTILILRSSAPLGLQDPQIEEASEVCWVACFQVGRHPEFPDLKKKMTLLGRAVELCPPERLPDVLGAWRP